MDDIKYIAGVIGGVIVAYLFITILMPLIVSVTGDAASEIAGSPNASTYVGSEAAANYTPLFLYFIPAAVGATVIYFRLRKDRK